ncbi:MAG: preprotein translocase subunit SecE [Victivallaceae bacterium]|nr:preprotein translocase subunit SecE [Victivallaceae bacterium]
MGKAESGTSVMSKVRGFVSGTVTELAKCTWPSKKELLESTILVVVAMLVLACFVAGVDELARYAIRIVTVGVN